MLETAAGIYVYQTFIGGGIVVAVFILWLLMHLLQNAKIFVYGILFIFLVGMIASVWAIVNLIS
jgi:hypothetical protein